MKLTKPSILSCAMALWTTFAPPPILADSNAFNPYAIPRAKSRLLACEQVSLAAQPGRVQRVQIHNTAEGFRYRFEILNPEGSLWAVVCDGETQKIIKRQALD